MNNNIKNIKKIFFRGFSNTQLLLTIILIIIFTATYFKLNRPKSFDVVLQNPKSSCISDTIIFIEKNKTCKKYIDQIQNLPASCQTPATIKNLSDIMKTAEIANCRTDIKK